MSREEVRAVREGIRSREEVTKDMDHFQVKISKVKEPTCLLSIEVLWLSAVGEVFVVGGDLDRKGGALKIMPPGLEAVNDCEEFPIINVIVAFCRGE